MKTNWVYWYQVFDENGSVDLTLWWRNIENDPIAKDYIIGTMAEGNFQVVSDLGYLLSNFVGAELSETGKAVKFEWELN